MASPPAPLSICHVDAERGFSGGEVQVFLLMHGLRERGHRQVLMAPPGSEASARAAREGFECREVAMRSDLDLAAVLRAGACLRELRCDLVHLHTGRAAWLAGLAAKRAGIPAVVTRRMDRRVSRGWRTALVYTKLAREVAAISASVADSLAEGGVARERITVIPSAVDPRAFAPRRARGEVRAELGAPEGAAVVMTLGALVHRKGVDVLLAALAALAQRGLEVQAWITGEGAARAELEAQARQLGLSRAKFLGRREDAADLLAAADVFAMPSRREGLGVAALEALAAGIPVVASGVGGLAEVVVSGESGLLVPPEDPSALARALESLLRDPALRERFARAGRARVAERHSAAGMVEAYEALYRRALLAGGARGEETR